MVRAFLRDEGGSTMLGHCFLLGMMMLSAATVANEMSTTFNTVFGRVNTALQSVAARLP